jgi:hypothetical protein
MYARFTRTTAFNRVRTRTASTVTGLIRYTDSMDVPRYAFPNPPIVGRRPGGATASQCVLQDVLHGVLLLRDALDRQGDDAVVVAGVVDDVVLAEDVEVVSDGLVVELSSSARWVALRGRSSSAQRTRARCFPPHVPVNTHQRAASTYSTVLPPSRKHVGRDTFEPDVRTARFRVANG